jgi:hypothetical protein
MLRAIFQAFLLAVCAPIGAFAQDLTPTPGTTRAYWFGIIGGATFFEINASDDRAANEVMGDKVEPIIGVVFAVNLGESLQLTPEAVVTVKGTRLSDDAELGGSLGPWDFRLTYLEVPVLARYRPGSSWLHLLGGPYVAWLLKANVEARDSATFVPDYSDAFEGFDAGWVVGIGAGGDRARIDFRYSRGLTDVDKDGDFLSLFTRDQSVRLTNRGFTFVGTVLF